MDKSSAELSNEIAEQERRLKEALSNLRTLEIEKLELQRQIIGLQAKKKDLEIVISKAGHIVKELRIDISLKGKEFWAARDGGL